MSAGAKIHWGRIIGGAFLVELALLVLTVPIAIFIGVEAFIPAVPPACFLVTFVVVWWLLRRVQSRPVLHGLSIGLLATAIYLGLALGQSGSLAPVIDIYGPFLFALANVLRVLGAVAGGAVAQRRMSAATAAISGTDPEF